MAMPETRIGFFPDVGATGWLFRKCRGKGYPEFLGLTGYDMSGAECVRIGLADCLIPLSSLDAARQALDRKAPDLPAGRKEAVRRLWEILDPLLDRDIPEDPGMDRWIQDYFAGRASVTEILDELSTCSTRNDLCRGVFERLSERSPSAVVATLKRLRRDEGRDLAEVFAADLEVARYLMQQHDFKEGVRARLIDRDDRPAWVPSTFDQASRDEQLMTIDRF
jgi:enoyl-CoA hydratase/carnithine racemase